MLAPVNHTATECEMDRHKRKAEQRQRRKKRVRKKANGTPERPRLAVFRSLKHIYSQVIDDIDGRTLASASTCCSEVRDEFTYGGNIKAAQRVGELIAKRAIDAGVSMVVFDRAGYNYHGRVKALAESARKAGLKF